MLDFGFYLFYALLIIAIVTALGFPILHAIKNPATLGKSALGVVGIVALFGISYALSDSDVSIKSQTLVGPGEARIIGAGLILFYISLALSVVALIYAEISKSLK